MPLPKAGSNSFFGTATSIFIIRFFPSLANLFVMIWYARYLPRDVYGSYQQFWIQLNVICPLACFGIHVLLITYSRDFVVILLRRVRTMQFAGYGAWVVALAAVFAGLQYRSLALPFWLPLLYLLFFAGSLILESFLVVCRRFRSVILLNALYAAAFCGIHVYMLSGAFSLVALFAGLLSVNALRFGLYLLLAAADIRNNKSLDAESVPHEKVRSLWLHLGVFDVAQMLFSWIDKFIISLVLSADMSAIYYNGSQNIPFLPLLLSAAGSGVLMQLAGGRKQDDGNDIVKLMNQSGRMLSCVVYPLFFFLLFFRNELFSFLFLNRYAEAVPVFMVSLFVLPVRAYSFTTVLQRLHRGRIINTGAVLDLVLACALMYPFYQLWGLAGVALSFVVTTWLQAAFYLFYSARMLGVGAASLVPYRNWLGKLIVFASVFIGIRYLSGILLNGYIGLFLAFIIMVASVIISLMQEMRKQRQWL